MANEAELADHLRTMHQRRSIYDFSEQFTFIHSDHVKRFIGIDLPWEKWGRIAVQTFRPPRACVYFIGGNVGSIKIGSSMAPLERFASMQSNSPIKLTIMALADGGGDAERSYHKRFAHLRTHGEWFERHPDILAEIANLNPPVLQPSSQGPNRALPQA